ncbi:predicted protein [Uncinocarpus reesii 1704]|uniref:N-acetyltransferase domain-containing protein n=1 Tax=Uncinocarpus reesii (strain UAMH 1704) TaxID=336963 RepID=C4JFK0_UNCRE|nr:uncharacterized protein UREG_01014 [Uncinocarpus reesii 1704]EEP76165.1 predicted protein [Uncinocarpus reesii 1704]
MPIRVARYADLATIPSILATGFDDEEVVGNLLHPYRKQFPQDYLADWRRRCRERFWDYSRVYLVSYVEEDATGKEILTGVAEWQRRGLGWERICGLWGWWDPRRLIKPIFTFVNFLANTLFPNRAAARPPDFTPSTINAAILPFVSHYFSAPYRQTTWTLTALAVLPQYQNRGHGRQLASWGLERAKQEGIVANVTSAKGKERFYHRCGFTELVGRLTDGDGNPLKSLGIEGGAILFTPYTRESKPSDG